MGDQRADRDLREPDERRLAVDHPRRPEILAVHSAALDAGEDAYVDPSSGLLVFTAAYLADRGTCCDTGCRHCPYIG